MNESPPLTLTPREVARLLIARRTLWLTPVVVCGALAAAYSLVMPRYWEASQALVVRQETAASQTPTPGKFADLFEMRTMQETILELAKSREVVVTTIKAVDARMNGFATEPTAEDVEQFRGRLKMLPPNGGEFGKTEVFYFHLKDRNRERAIELVGELCRQLDAALKHLRAKRAAGLIAELEEQAELAVQTHAQHTERLAKFEAEVGADLGELRMLHAAASGQSDLRQAVVQLEADARRFATQLREAQQLLAMLRAAEQDPEQLLATPNSLLVSQPALRRLKEGLVDAQLATARLAGTRSADHPRVKAAIESEKEIRADLHRELLTAIRGAEAEVRLSQQRVDATHTRLSDVEARLTSLAERRAEYSNRVAAVENSRITLDRTRQDLSVARAAEAAARSGSLVTRIDKPETGPFPAGPGRTVVAGSGVMGGLMLGLGLVFLTAGAAPTSPRLQTSIVGERASDQAPSAATKALRSEPGEEFWSSRDRSADSSSAPDVAQYDPAPVQRVAASSRTPESPQRQRTAGEPAKPGAPERPRQPVTPTASPMNKPGLPNIAGKLPNAAGTLPPLATPAAVGGMSLQEALQAARQAQL